MAIDAPTARPRRRARRIAARVRLHEHQLHPGADCVPVLAQHRLHMAPLGIRVCRRHQRHDVGLPEAPPSPRGGACLPDEHHQGVPELERRDVSVRPVRGNARGVRHLAEKGGTEELHRFADLGLGAERHQGDRPDRWRSRPVHKAAAHPGHDLTCDRPQHCSVDGDQPVELVDCQAQARAVAVGDHRCRPDLAVDERHLPDHLTPTHVADESLRPGAVPDPDLQASGKDHENVIGRLALPHEDGAAGDLTDLDHIGKTSHAHRVEPTEQVDRRQQGGGLGRAGHVLDPGGRRDRRGTGHCAGAGPAAGRPWSVPDPPVTLGVPPPDTASECSYPFCTQATFSM